MLSKEKKRTNKKKGDSPYNILRQKAVILLTLLIFLLILIFGKNGYLNIIRLTGQVESLKQEIANLELKNKKLMAEINALKTDPNSIEAQARSAGMIKKGEKIVKIVPESEVLNDR